MPRAVATPATRAGADHRLSAGVLPPQRQRERMLTVASLFAGDAQLPMIRIHGSWLEELGFKIGMRMAISEEQGRLILTLAGEE